jgi:asparagine synthase (glutamine-hydrolysing)
MFAFALWDRTRQELFLARDRYGIKPLYYVLAGSVLVFASEQKAILNHPAVKREVDLEGLIEYFTFQNLFTDRTLLKNVRLFPPGSYARVPLGTCSDGIRPTQYWSFNFQEPETPAREEEYSKNWTVFFSKLLTVNW